MLKSLLLGIGTLILISIFCWIVNDWSYIYKVSGILGAASLIGCGIAVGSFNTSMGTRPLPTRQFKANQDIRDNRVKWSARILLFGVPHIIAAGIYIYVVLLD